MTSTSDDLDPTTEHRDLVGGWSEAIIERLGLKGYLPAVTNPK